MGSLVPDSIKKVIKLIEVIDQALMEQSWLPTQSRGLQKINKAELGEVSTPYASSWFIVDLITLIHCFP